MFDWCPTTKALLKLRLAYWLLVIVYNQEFEHKNSTQACARFGRTNVGSRVIIYSISLDRSLSERRAIIPMILVFRSKDAFIMSICTLNSYVFDYFNPIQHSILCLRLVTYVSKVAAQTVSFG